MTMLAISGEMSEVGSGQRQAKPAQPRLPQSAQQAAPQTAIAAICEQLGGAQDLSAFKAALASAVAATGAESAASNSPNGVKLVHQLQTLLVRETSLKWVVCLTDHEQSTLFRPLFARHTQPPQPADPLLVHSVVVLFDATRFAVTALHRHLLAATLARVLDMHPVADLAASAWAAGSLSSSSQRHPQPQQQTAASAQWLQVRRAISTLPDIHINGDTDGQTQQPALFAAETFIDRIVTEVDDTLRRPTLHGTDGPTPDWMLVQMAGLVQDLTKRGHADIMAKQIVLLAASRPGAGQWQKLLEQMARADACVLAQSLIVQVDRLHLAFDDTLDALRNVLGNSALLQDVACRAARQQQYSLPIMDALLWLVCKDSEPSCQQSVLAILTSVWTSRDFVGRGDFEYQKRIFVSLVLAVHYTPAKALNALEPIRRLLQGIPQFLEIGSALTRQLGLRFGELLSKRMHPEVKLDFQLTLLPEVQAVEAMMALGNADIGLPIVFRSSASNAAHQASGSDLHAGQSSQSQATRKPLPAASQSEDPDAPVAPSSRLVRSSLFDDNDDSDDEAEETQTAAPHVPASVHANQQPLQFGIATRNPHRKGFLADCLAVLKKDQQPDEFEACLKDLAPLVLRATHLEIEELHGDVCTRLVYLEDTFETEGYDQYRLAAWVALCLRRPVDSARAMSQSLFDRNCGLSTRFWILRAWQLAVLDQMPMQTDDPQLAALWRQHRPPNAYQIAEPCVLALFDQLADQRHWRDLFGQDHMYAYASEVLRTVKVLMLSTHASPHRARLMDELHLFLQAFDRQENRLLFMQDLMQLARIADAGAV
ncbi:hypothetical protein BC831DRAFT_480369 [Entophlyctis helioformis]|nr:hypothetical protein BC831DRAFT_480369 [Entophlyctis helioformis]